MSFFLCHSNSCRILPVQNLLAKAVLKNNSSYNFRKLSKNYASDLSITSYKVYFPLHLLNHVVKLISFEILYSSIKIFIVYGEQLIACWVTKNMFFAH